jgi:CheY-like chemotaxis protein
MDVLVVEDEALVREVVSEHLACDGLAVAEAPSAEDALTLTQADGAPAVVVTDVNLGAGMSGLALAEEVHRRWPATGVVVMTGNPLNIQDRAFGPHERYLLKPFQPMAMLQAVRELMRQSKPQPERLQSPRSAAD